MVVCLCFGCVCTPARAGAAENGDTVVLEAEAIRAMNALKMPDILNNVSGVQAGDSSVSIHGSYKVKVFVDGRPINDPTSSHGGVNWDMISPEDVAHIEVLKGRGGLTYGRDAGGGVILITTERDHRLSGYVKAYGGSHNTQDYSAALSTTSGRFSLGVSGGYETTGGYKTNNDKERYQTGLKLSYDLEEKKKITFSADYLEDKRGLSGLPDYPTPFSRKQTRNTAYSLTADFHPVNSRTYYNAGRRDNTDETRGVDNTLEVANFGEDIATTFHTTDRGDLSCGAALTWDKASGTAFEDQDEHAISLFASQSITFPDRHVTFTAGLRGNYHSAFANTVNPEIKLIYKKAAWQIAAAYSRTDNAPSFYQRYNETSSTRPNRDLVMETADNLSVEFSASPLEGFSFTISGFYNRLSDRITYVTGNEGIGRYQNFGEVLYQGGDLAFTWQMMEGLKLKTSYTYLEATDAETGLWLPCKARHTGRLTVYWKPLRALSVVFDGKSTSSVYRNKQNTKEIPGYSIADLRAEYAFSRFQLFGKIENMFDKTYYYADGLLAPPRTWVVGINWRI
ncbi:iron complex outermembrane receptor protein [Desulfosalsimonas propionicica]|uniref:Iron complex outermembrane receptor protein n=1 Tax=Desulfosalsimonas propionicica TaxID=332175 RepID=A0A7W0HLB9_9BACT|nr:TonB-dependent receptor plug domain-containing protein [Desulfosalsimonas propionicica]MBA2882123.1 iron complex outermembrane receptor protein [Desulfosalsimonas propionicica]